jgi:LPXTG-site transpeptidase (sortase) family protein
VRLGDDGGRPQASAAVLNLFSLTRQDIMLNESLLAGNCRALQPVARLTVPSKNIDLLVLNGAYHRTLAFGPGYAESSALPSSVGTTILTGHRDTHFRFLKELTREDELVIQTARGNKLRYVVSERRIVDSRSGTITLDPSQPRLVLVTCYPFDAMTPGGPLRYVVVAEESWRHKAQASRASRTFVSESVRSMACRRARASKQVLHASTCSPHT